MTDVRRVVAGRIIRGFVDGFVSVLLAQYLTDLGFSPLRVGAIVTATLLGSAVLTLTFGLRAHRTTLGRLLRWACLLMAVTGAGFAATTAFWPMLIVATVGTLNPSGGDVSVFLPTEQAFLADHVHGQARTRLYAIYNLGAIVAGALGALGSGLPERVASATGWRLVSTERVAFLVYAAAGLVILALYRSLPDREAPVPGKPRSRWPTRRHRDDGATPEPDPAGRPSLATARPVVLQLAALFSLDSAGSGFVGTSLLVLWLHLRFGLSRAHTAEVFFAVGLLGACSQLFAPMLAKRIGLIRTMVFTHLPANVLLALAAFAPDGRIAIALLLTRALFAQMDVPARQAFVMSVVPPQARAAASSITNVPRSLAAATTPLIAGALLSHTTFGWPLLIAGTAKITYDLLLLALHRDTAEFVADGAPNPP